MEKNTKLIFQLDSPYTQVTWPQISSEHQDTILELLCSLLSPIGQWRSNFIVPSKGKRDRKRKRKEAKLRGTEQDETKPPAPEISSFIEVGLNSITRKLEEISQTSKLETQSSGKETDSLEESEVPHESDVSHMNGSDVENVTVMSKNHKAVPFAAVFVLRPSQPTVLHAHLPLLIATSTLATPNVPAPRVVQLPSGCGARLCESLGLARVSFIGLREGAPNSTQVVDLIRRVVPEVRIPWVEETKNATYLPVKINMIKTKIGKHKGNAPNPNNKASGKTKTDVVNT